MTTSAGEACNILTGGTGCSSADTGLLFEAPQQKNPSMTDDREERMAEFSLKGIFNKSPKAKLFT
jgi:hypothetical protein